MQARAQPSTRQDYLAEVFGGSIAFIYRKIPYNYIYITRIGDILAARIGRPRRELRTSGPEEEYAPFEDAGNIAVNVFIDTAGDPDGQKVAIQFNTSVGSPSSLIETLVRKINEADVDADWQIEVRPIIDENTFWTTVEKNEKSITSIQFKLVAPNVLGFSGSVFDEMKMVRDENNAEIVSVGIENKNIIRLNTDSIRNAIKYVSEGAGDVILKIKSKIIFDSRRKQRSIAVKGDAPIARGNEDALKETTTTLFGR
jgi:hypothetical protein